MNRYERLIIFLAAIAQAPFPVKRKMLPEAVDCILTLDWTLFKGRKTVADLRRRSLLNIAAQLSATKNTEEADRLGVLAVGLVKETWPDKVTGGVEADEKFINYIVEKYWKQ